MLFGGWWLRLSLTGARRIGLGWMGLLGTRSNGQQTRQDEGNEAFTHILEGDIFLLLSHVARFCEGFGHSASHDRGVGQNLGSLDALVPAGNAQIANHILLVGAHKLGLQFDDGSVPPRCGQA